MTKDDFTLKIKSLNEPKIREKFKVFYYEQTKTIPADSTIRNWAKGRFEPKMAATILIQKFFNESKAMSE